MKKLLVLLAGLVILVPCVYGQDEYEVYSALLKENLSPSGVIVVSDRTTESREALHSTIVIGLESAAGIKIDKALQDRYAELNGSSVPVEPRFDEDLNVRLISAREMDEIFKDQDGWNVFRQQYGKTCHATLSRVAFNDAGDLALVYMGRQCDWLAGTGIYYLLKKDGGVWKEVARSMAWIS